MLCNLFQHTFMRLLWSHDPGHEFGMLTYHGIMITSYNTYQNKL